MNYTLRRRVYFQSAEAGLVAKDVSKVIESEVPPQIGYQYEDTAWHRNDIPKAESVLITESGSCIVELETLQVGSAAAVEQLYQQALKPNGWLDGNA